MQTVGKSSPRSIRKRIWSSEYYAQNRGSSEKTILGNCCAQFCHCTPSFPIPHCQEDEEYGAVGSLVVRAPNSRPEGLSSMPVPPNTIRVHTEYMLVKSVGPKFLWAESRVQETGENFPPLQFHA
ncbi:uncharacterized protein TNCV_4658221 [Trichonephila clavipes]|nr:uncharacterized protein TNCV_4658221 [Trichonephila clavipes]